MKPIKQARNDTFSGTVCALIRRCAVRTYTVPYGAVRSNRTRVELRRRSHYARRRTSPFWCYRGNRVVFYFCGILPYGAMEPHGSAVLPVDLYGFLEPLKLFFQKKLIQTFHVPTLSDGAKNCWKVQLPAQTMPYGVPGHNYSTVRHRAYSVNGPLVLASKFNHY